MASKVAIEVEIKNIKKVADLKESLKTLRKETKAYEKEVAEGTKQTEKSAKGYINSSKAIKNQSKDLRNLKKDLSGSTKATKAATKSSNGMAKQFVKGAAAIGLAVAAFRTAAGVVSNAIQSFRDFEFQMAKVGAITGANRSEFLKLAKSAQDLGRSTFFTAQQVAELQTNYGKLGFTTQEILNAQEATLMLATATDSDLARAAIVAGSAVRGFGLDASETQRVVDVMAVAFTSSALDIEKFQTSMTKVAPIAKSAGFSIEDTTAIMSQLADSGIEASIAGTSLRNILLKMQDPNSDLVKSFGKTIHSLDELVPAMAKFSEEGGSLAEIMEVVDLRQAAAFEQMITSSERTVELRDALKDASGAAEEMARIVGDTLEGAFKRSESATQGFRIAFIDRMSEGLKNVTDGFASFISKLTDFIEIPISEKIQKDKFEMDALFEVLKDTNVAQETRNRAMVNLNKKYSEYLPKLITEKDNVKELSEHQKNANLQMAEKIRMMGAEESLLKIQKEGQEIQAELFDTELRIRENQGKILRGEEEIQQGKYTTINVTQGQIDADERRVKKLKEEADAYTKKYENALIVAEEFGVKLKDNEEVESSLTEKTNESTNAIVVNTQAKIDNSIGTELQAEANRDYLDIMNLVLEGTITQKEAEEALRLEKIKAIEDALIAIPLGVMSVQQEAANYALRMSLEKQLIDLKLTGISDEVAARKQQIDGVAKLGDQIINLAGEDKKMQGIKKAGIALSSAAAIANNIQALSEMSLGVASQSKLLFPANIIGMVTTLSTIVSLFANIKSMKSAFGDGGMIEEFANGGMVNGKSHAQGGEKFAVGGRVVELEGGEAVINKRSTAMFRNQLSSMNSAGGGVKFADGGLMSSPSFTESSFAASNQSAMMGAMGGQRKVVVVESDITTSQSTVSVIQSNATF